MNVPQLLDPFLLCPNVEIVKPILPKPIRSIGGNRRRKWAAPGLAEFARPWSTEPLQAPNKTELQSLHGDRKCGPLRFRHQQMHMFRHNDITQKDKSISPPHTLKDFEEVRSVRNVEKRQAVITAEGDKMQVLSAISTVKMLRHRRRVKQLGSIRL